MSRKMGTTGDGLKSPNAPSMEILAGMYSSSSTSNESVIDMRSSSFGIEVCVGLGLGGARDGLSVGVSFEVSERNMAGSSGVFLTIALVAQRTSDYFFFDMELEDYPKRTLKRMIWVSQNCLRLVTE